MHPGAPFPGKGKPFGGPPPGAVPQPFKGALQKAKGKGKAHAVEAGQQQSTTDDSSQWPSWPSWYDQSAGSTYWPDNS